MISWFLFFFLVHIFVLIAICLVLRCPSSESSSQALSVFNKAGLLDVVIQCLEQYPQNVELAISAGRLKLSTLNCHVDMLALC